ILVEARSERLRHDLHVTETKPAIAICEETSRA
ncbi:unnamed protein product, partial [Cuscuta campestris]